MSGQTDRFVCWFEDNLRSRWFGPRYWRALLLADGTGWLRWATDDRIAYSYNSYEPPESFVVAPPLRRIVWMRRARGWHYSCSFFHGCRVIWHDYSDPDRKGDLRSVVSRRRLRKARARWAAVIGETNHG